MINWGVFGLCELLKKLREIEYDFDLRRKFVEAELKYGASGYEGVKNSDIPYEVSDADKSTIKTWMEYATHIADQTEMQPVHDRIDLFRARLNDHIELHDFFAEVRALREALENGSKLIRVYRYPQDKALTLLNAETHWQDAIKQFPSCKTEVIAGIDCWAMGQPTACVFHMSRVGEIGLRAIGRERGVKTVRGIVPIEWGTWGQVFQAIEPTLVAIRKRPNGPKKDAALAFYDTVLSDLRAIHSLYRDPSMHFRGSYDDGEAQSALFRAHSLMTMLSTKLNEQSNRAISWSAWP